MQTLHEFRIRQAYDRLVKKVMGKIEKLGAGMAFEANETKHMMRTFFTQIKELLSDKKTVTDEDVKRALKQVGDIGKFSLVAPLFMMPLGGTTTAVLYLTGKKYFGISILPEGFEQVFQESIETIEPVDIILNEKLANSL